MEQSFLPKEVIPYVGAGGGGGGALKRKNKHPTPSSDI